MGIKPDWQCEKGDVAKETLKFQILAEKSSPKNGRTISLWKSQSDRFEVALYDENKRIKKEQWKTIYTGNEEAKARSEYKEACKNHGLSPYPEDC